MTAGREVERAAIQHWRRDTRSAVTLEPATPVAWVPPDAETLGVSRRQFLNRGSVALFGLGFSGFAVASLGFLWPRAGGGFGGQIKAGKLSDILARIDEGDGFLYIPQGRMWITRHPTESLDKARARYSPPELAGMEQGVVALYQKCPHLGCRVPQCVTSRWFECPCHGSQYNQVGEKKGGPAPRGMDRFAMRVDAGSLTVDQPDHRRTAYRHQHHRPRSRRTPLRHTWRRRIDDARPVNGCCNSHSPGGQERMQQLPGQHPNWLENRDANLFFADGEVSAVIDWDKAEIRSRGQEIIRAMQHSFGFEPAMCQAFVGGYRSEAALTCDSLAAAAVGYGHCRDCDLWLAETIFLDGDDRPKRFVTPGSFVPFAEIWAPVEVALLREPVGSEARWCP